MAEPPSVSVVLPFFQRADSVVAAAESVLAQAGVAVELVAVDDGSTDDGAARLVALGDARLRVLRHESNRGAAAARNSGIAAAAYDLIAFLDSDDAFLPGKLAAQAALLRADRLDLCFGGFLLEGAGGSSLVTLPARSAEAWAVGFLDGCRVSPGSTMLATRAALARLGPYDEALGRLEDWDLMLRAATMGLKFGAIAAPVARVNPARHPSPAAVDPALEAIATRHAGAVALRWGAAGRRRLCASIAIERAVARWRAGRRLAGIFALLPALAAPARLGALIAGRRTRTVATAPPSAYAPGRMEGTR